MADEFSQFCGLLAACNSPDQATLDMATKQHELMVKTNPADFLMKCLAVLQQAETVPPEVIGMALILSRGQIKKSLVSVKTREPQFEYLFVPEEVINQYLGVTIALCGHPVPAICHHSAMMIGQCVHYVLYLNAAHPVLPTLIQNLENAETVQMAITSLKFIVEERYFDDEQGKQIQAETLRRLLPLLGSAEVPVELKTGALDIMSNLTSVLSDIFKTPADKESFFGSLTALTEIPDMKLACYNFWETIAIEFPDHLTSLPRLLEISVNDLGNTDNDTAVFEKIHKIWEALAKLTVEQAGGEAKQAAPLLVQAVGVLLPILLTHAGCIEDPTELDDPESDPFWVTARNAILQLAWFDQEQAIPILIACAQQSVDAENPCQVEVAMCCFQLFLMLAPEAPALDETWVALLGQTADACLAKLGCPSMRVVQMVLMIVCDFCEGYPGFRDFTGLIEPMMQLFTTPLAEAASQTISAILASISSDPAALEGAGTVCAALLDKLEHPEALSCIGKYLEKCNEQVGPIVVALMPKAIAAQEFIVANPQIYPDVDVFNTAIDQIMRVVDVMLHIAGEHGAPVYDHVFEFTLQCNNHFDTQNAITILTTIATRTQKVEHVNAAMTQILSNITVDSPPDRLRIAIECVGYMTLCNINDHFGDIVLQIANVWEPDVVDLGAKVACIEGLNCLHEHYPERIQSYYDRLLPTYHSMIVSIPALFDYDDEDIGPDATYYLMRAVHLMMEVAWPTTAAAAKATLAQFAMEMIKHVVYFNDYMKDERPFMCMTNGLLKLKEMDPPNTLAFIMQTEGLKDLLEHLVANADSDELKAAIATLMS